MTIYNGSSKIKTFYYGGSKISKVYYGSTLMYTAFTPQTKTFNYTGAVQTWTVPQGVRYLKVDCVGAAGNASASGGSYTPTNGKGGRVQCDLSVTPGQVLNIYVGGINGYNGGGTSSTYGKGGGASDIRIGGTALANRKVVAGGAGGGLSFSGFSGIGGNGGGLVGGNGTGYSAEYAGKGGSQTSGGAGGSGGGVGEAGSLGQGGGGQRNLPGGGGYYGGGSGSSDGYYGIPSGAGGGGSSYTDSTLCTNVIHTQGYASATGNGWITITTAA